MYYRNKKITAMAADLLKILVIVVAAFFVVSLANATGAAAYTVTGKVVSIDKHKETLTVDSSYAFAPNRGSNYAGGASGLNTFAFNKRAYVLMGDEKIHFNDISKGDWVIVNFHEESNGLVIADGITLTPPPAPYAGASAQIYSLSGKIVAIDRDANTFSLVPSYYYGTNYSGTRIFAFDRDAWVMMGSNRMEFRDLKIGDWVTVNFHQEIGGFGVVEGIAVIYPPMPYPEERAQMFSLTGRVVALDRDAKTLTVYPSYCYEPNFRGEKASRIFAFGHGTTVMMGSESRDFRDIRVGDLVTVNYHQESNGLVITDGIAITFPSAVSCPEERG